MRIGRYEVIDEIGAGGMGRVRLARDPSGRLVVLKTALRNDVDDDERLRDEARVGLRVRHPSLVETLDLFDYDDGKSGRSRPVLVTAYVPGVSLLELRRVGAVHPLVVCRLGRQLAEALDAIHDARADDGTPLGVLHRDVTAGNCLIGHDGRARLIDLGISRSTESKALRTETGLLRGTLRYLAPELFDGGQYSAQSDLWALGVVLWEALIGRSAVSGSDAVAVGRICSGSLMSLDDGEVVEPRVARAISQLLKKSPNDRPRRAREAAALFAMLEKAGPRGANGTDNADELAQALVWRAIGGPDVEGETSVVVERAARAFADEDLMTPTGPIIRNNALAATPSSPLRALPPTVSDRASDRTSSSDPFAAKKTPSNAIADYAASVQSMEKALAAAWEKANAAQEATLSSLPVVTGHMLQEQSKREASEKTAPAPPAPSSPFDGHEPLSPFLFEETDDDGPSQVGQLIAAFATNDAPLPDQFQFPPAFPLPPMTPLMVSPRAASSAAPSAPPHQDHDEISTPGAVRPAVTLVEVPTGNADLPADLMPKPTRWAAVVGLTLLLVAAAGVAVIELGIWTPPVDVAGLAR